MGVRRSLLSTHLLSRMSPLPLSPGFMRRQSGLRLRYAGMKGER
ncbi:hypothetical protein HMPREF0577_1068 [Mobiluncus mulieris ATCC 35243]|nr:hypothetical protein HMPREF0577_1068 [Mobiluncus mulieris ATCC 35243]